MGWYQRRVHGLYDMAEKNPQNTIQHCWEFAYRQIDASDKGIKTKGTSPKEASSPVIKDIATLINEMESLENKMKEKEENFESKMNELKTEYSSEMKKLEIELQGKRRELAIELKQFKK